MTAPTDRAPGDLVHQTLQRSFERLDRALDAHDPGLVVEEVGRVARVSEGIAIVRGLPSAASEELLQFREDLHGIVWNLDRDGIGVILLDPHDRIEAGEVVRGTGRVMDVPVGEGLLGRVVDALGRPLDGRGRVPADGRLPVERPAPAIVDRDPVRRPLQTGTKVIDALVPIGRGQRELVVGDRQTGKTQICVDAIINQRHSDIVSIYCGIGQRASAIASVVADLQEHAAFDRTIVVAAGGHDPAGQQFLAPYAATSMAEHLVDQGRDVLLVLDDLTRHARVYRELSLLLRRPPGREAYPGDVFYIHSRLLERAAQLSASRGGGSLTVLPVVETQAQNISAYIPTNLISITDGQIYLDPGRFQRGVLPAVDVGRSVSRVGGNAQVPAYRVVAGDLRLAYSQFEELERFSRYGARLEESRRQELEHGRRVREVFKQQPASPWSVGEQIPVLLAVTAGLFDDLPVEEVHDASTAVARATKVEAVDLLEAMERGERLGDEELDRLLGLVRGAVEDHVAGRSGSGDD